MRTYALDHGLAEHPLEGPQEMQAEHRPGYLQLLADLGISSFDDLEQRGEQVRESLPGVWQVAEDIMAAHPGIEG